jgi:CheY-like chemotaxis protein
MTMLIVDDSDRMRRHIRGALVDLADQIYECADGYQAVALYALHRPDWLVMDISMPGMSGIEATRRIRESSPAARIVILTIFNNQSLRDAAQEAGAFAYVLKDDLAGLRQILTNSAGTSGSLERLPK